MPGRRMRVLSPTAGRPVSWDGHNLPTYKASEAAMPVEEASTFSRSNCIYTDSAIDKRHAQGTRKLVIAPLVAE